MAGSMGKKSALSTGVKILLASRQRKLACDMRWLRRLAPLALRHCLAARPLKAAVLSQLPEVAVTLVSDTAIARMHLDFMGLPGPTDVITFHHGEIVISVETAAVNAARYRRSLDEEVALYLIHGLLHLHGYLDKKPADAALMQKTQATILRRCLAELKKCEPNGVSAMKR